LLKESLGIVVVITSSVIMVQRIEQERIHYGIYLGFKDILRFQVYIYLSLSVILNKESRTRQNKRRG
jgi:hypothetical protein